MNHAAKGSVLVNLRNVGNLNKYDLAILAGASRARRSYASSDARKRERKRERERGRERERDARKGERDRARAREREAEREKERTFVSVRHPGEQLAGEVARTRPKSGYVDPKPGCFASA